MMTQACHILSGKLIASRRLDAFKKRIEELRKEGVSLKLGTVRVGEAPDTLIYSKAIDSFLRKIGIGYLPRVFSEKITQEALFKEILKLNADPEVTGILIFSPLPRHIDAVNILSAVDLLKDVEGRRVLHGVGDRVLSPTAVAVMVLLEETGAELVGLEAVVVGRSDVVGKPCAILLMDKGVTVTVCHSRTKNLREHIQKADVVIATVGKANLIKGEWVKKGAIVIDVGENMVDGKLVGDVEFEFAKEKAAFISPVPGGVGPVTNVTLIENLMTLHKLGKVWNGNR